MVSVSEWGPNVSNPKKICFKQDCQTCFCGSAHVLWKALRTLPFFQSTHMRVARNRGLSRSPSSVTNLCRGLFVTNPCRGPLCRVLQSPIGLSQGGFVARLPTVTSLVAKRAPGPVTSPMFLGMRVGMEARVPVCLRDILLAFSVVTCHSGPSKTAFQNLLSIPAEPSGGNIDIAL